MPDASAFSRAYAELKSAGLSLSMTRGQPADDQFDLSRELLQIVGPDETAAPSGVALRNYPGGVAGLPEARELFGGVLGASAEETVVGNNSSLMLMGQVLTWALLYGLPSSPAPWAGQRPKMIVTAPGYDRHFSLLEGMGYEPVPVPVGPEGPDLDAVESLAASDASFKGMLFVPVYSNPTGDSISDAGVERLASLPAAAPDFTVLADNAYAVHHLGPEKVEPRNLLRAAAAAGHPERVWLFGSTSKITFAGAGLGFLAGSRTNVAWYCGRLGLQSIGPNKIEQYRHVKFLRAYPGGLEGLMQAHAALIRPKFEAVQRVLHEELEGTGLARWTDPKGGYFVSLDTALPVADRVVALAKDAGIALTPAGATWPGGVDPHNRNIRLAPTRPPLAEVEKAMQGVALCVKLASAEAG